MKRIIKSFRTVAMSVTFLSGITASVPVFANNEESNPSIEFKFIGRAKNHLAFLLELKNSNKEKYTVNISDAEGNVLYMEKIKGTDIKKTFFFNKEEIGEKVLFVKVKLESTKLVEVYEINTKSKVIEETIINKLK